MSKTVSIRALFLLAGLSFLTGCIRSPLKIHTKQSIKLNQLDPQNVSFEQTIDDITVRAHQLSQKEYKEILGKKKSAITAIQVDIVNDSPFDYVAEKKDIDLPLISIEKLVHQFKRPKIAPVCFLVGIWSGLATAYGVLLGAPYAAVGLVGVIDLVTVNRSINRDNCVIENCLQKIYPKIVKIKAHKTKSILLFIETDDVPDSFNVSVHPAATHTITHNFTVTL